MYDLPPGQSGEDSALPENATPQLEIDGPDRQNRLVVAFRALLAIPQMIVLAFLQIAQMFVLFVGWFAALAMGRLPDWVRRYLINYLRYSTRVSAYLYLLVDRYPPFSFSAPADYPVRLDLRSGRLNRWAVLFRLILCIPAYIVSAVLSTGWALCAFFLWLAVLITGRAPAPVFGAVAAMLRYSVRFQAYSAMLTSAYPKSVFGEGTAGSDGQQPVETPRGTRPLVLTGGARVLLIVFIVLGILGVIGDGVLQSQQQPQFNAYVASQTG